MSLWEVDSGKEVRELEWPNDFILHVASSQDYRYIASDSDNNTARLWEVNSGKEAQKLESHEYGVTKVAFSNDSRYLLALADKIFIWDILNGHTLLRCNENSRFIYNFHIRT